MTINKKKGTNIFIHNYLIYLYTKRFFILFSIFLHYLTLCFHLRLNGIFFFRTFSRCFTITTSWRKIVYVCTCAVYIFICEMLHSLASIEIRPTFRMCVLSYPEWIFHPIEHLSKGFKNTVWLQFEYFGVKLNQIYIFSERLIPSNILHMASVVHSLHNSIWIGSHELFKHI